MKTPLYRELLLGCGHKRDRRIHVHRFDNDPTPPNQFLNVTTVDNNPQCKPDCVADLQFPELLTAFFPDNAFDEIHAYEVLEHIGRQGDYRTFFAQFFHFWRLLKGGGYFCATVPHYQSLWAWGDPGHTRIINEGTITFLDRREYDRQIGNTSMSDYRRELGDANFEIVQANTRGQTFAFILKVIK